LNKSLDWYKLAPASILNIGTGGSQMERLEIQGEYLKNMTTTTTTTTTTTMIPKEIKSTTTTNTTPKIKKTKEVVGPTLVDLNDQHDDEEVEKKKSRFKIEEY